MSAGSATTATATDAVPDARAAALRPHAAGRRLLDLLAGRSRPEHLDLQPARRDELSTRQPGSVSLWIFGGTNIGGTAGSALPPISPDRSAPRRRRVAAAGTPAIVNAAATVLTPVTTAEPLITARQGRRSSPSRSCSCSPPAASLRSGGARGGNGARNEQAARATGHRAPSAAAAAACRARCTRSPGGSGRSGWRRRQPDDQPAAAPADLRGARPGRGACAAPHAPWARGYRFYLLMALTVIAIRVVFRVVFESGVTPGDHILFRLPQIPTPSLVRRRADRRAGVARGGAVGGPRRAAAGLPALLHRRRQHPGQPQAGAAGAARRAVRARRRRHRRLVSRAAAGRERPAGRAGPGGCAAAGGRAASRALRASRSRCLHDALDRSLLLAAAWTRAATAAPAPRSRGEPAADRRAAAGRAGRAVRRRVRPARQHRAASARRWPDSLPGRSCACAGLALGGRRVSRSHYRPDPWRWPEWVVVACGVASAVVLCLNDGLQPRRAEPVACTRCTGRRCRCSPRPRSCSRRSPRSPRRRLPARQAGGRRARRPLRRAGARLAHARRSDVSVIDFDQVSVTYDGAAARSCAT